MHYFRIRGEIQIWRTSHLGVKILRMPVHTEEAAATPNEAIRYIDTDISGLYGETWKWLWWQAEY